MVWLKVLVGILFVVLAPALGCLIAGADRIVTARMQGRQGPPLLQPYYDLRKLLEKDRAANDSTQLLFMGLALLFVVAGGVTFFVGMNFLVCVFLETLGSLMYIVAASVVSSPYVQTGVQREILQVMCYEPLELLVAVGIFLLTGSFSASALAEGSLPMVIWLPLIFCGLLFVLTIKLRKSPFDIAGSHHAHQEIVAGANTEMSGLTLAVNELTHWYETVIVCGWVGMFFINSNPLSWALAVLAVVIIYLLEIWVDNTFARVKWQVMLKGSWLVAIVAGMVNFSVFYFINSNGIVFF